MNVESIRQALARRGAHVFHVSVQVNDEQTVIAYLHEGSGRTAAEESRRIVRSLPGVESADFMSVPYTLLIISLSKPPEHW